jgi:1-phosphofructokinase family hexose kinase
MLLIVNLNPCLERIYTMRGFRLNEVHRTGEVLVQAGGKGINVARATRTLGGTCLVTGVLGGYAGQHVTADLKHAGIVYDFSPISQETRTCIAIIDPLGQTQTVVNESGPAVSDGEAAHFVAQFAHLLPSARLVVLAGSLPQGIVPCMYGDLIRLASEKKLACVVDASGEALRAGIAARPFMVKVNVREISEIWHAPELVPQAMAGDMASLIARCRLLLDDGVAHVVVTLGVLGALWVSKEETWWAKPPQITVVNAIGSGDAFTAGVTHAWLQGKQVVDMLTAGVAAGTANATLGGLRFSLEIYQALSSQIATVRM